MQQDSFIQAKQQHDAAFHLFKVTYPLVQDPKLLLGIVTNIYNSYDAAIETLLRYERERQLVPAFGSAFLNKFNVFRSKSAKRNHIDEKQVKTIEFLYQIQEAHKKSPVEFRRGDRFVICNDDFGMQIIDTKRIQELLDHNSAFLKTVSQITKRNP